MQVVWMDEFQVASGGTQMGVGQRVELRVMTPSPEWVLWFEPVFGDVVATVTGVEEHHNQRHLTHRLAGRVDSLRVGVARFVRSTDSDEGASPAVGSGRVVQVTGLKPTTPRVALDEGEQVVGFFAEINESVA